MIATKTVLLALMFIVLIMMATGCSEYWQTDGAKSRLMALEYELRDILKDELENDPDVINTVRQIDELVSQVKATLLTPGSTLEQLDDEIIRLSVDVGMTTGKDWPERVIRLTWFVFARPDVEHLIEKNSPNWTGMAIKYLDVILKVTSTILDD